jgi:hypothetical protein
MYTATITRNFRDINTLSPKVLMLNIREAGKPFRDHAWVNITPELEKFIPYKNTQKLRLAFEAKPKTYKTYGPEKITLQSIRNIEIRRDR